MARYYESSGLPQEAVGFFQRTLAGLESEGPDRPTALLGQIQYRLAESLLSMARYEEATTAVQAAQATIRALEEVALSNRLFITQAYIFNQQGLYPQALAVLEEAIAFSQAHDDIWGVARAKHA